MKAKHKTVLLVGVTTGNFTNEMAKKTVMQIRETLGMSKKRFPILVYDKTRIDLELMDLPR